METRWVLTAKRPEVAAKRLEQCFRQQLRLLELAVRRAAKGEPSAARDYLATWHHLAASMLRLVREERPDAVVTTKTGELLVVDIKGDPIEVTSDLLLAVAPTAPFSSWVAIAGLSRGIALRLLAEVREVVPGSVPLVPKPGVCPHWAEPEAMRTALRLIKHALWESPAVRESTPLQRVMDLFGLDRTESAKLFGVTRQAVEQWERRGVPAERQEKLSTVLAIGELLARKLRPGVLPGVARRPAEAYGGRSMLQMIADDKHEAVLKSVHASFDWAVTA